MTTKLERPETTRASTLAILGYAEYRGGAAGNGYKILKEAVEDLVKERDRLRRETVYEESQRLASLQDEEPVHLSDEMGLKSLCGKKLTASLSFVANDTRWGVAALTRDLCPECFASPDREQ